MQNKITGIPDYDSQEIRKLQVRSKMEYIHDLDHLRNKK